MTAVSRVPSWFVPVQPAAATTAMIAAAAVAAAIGERWLDPQSLALFFVVPVVLAAMHFGLRPALAASLLSVAALNYLFVEPRYTWAVARLEDLGALILFAIVSVLVSIIAERARAAEAARLEAARERFKSELLAGVSHDLRTPLATILFTLQSLQRFGAEHAPATRDELLALAEGEARRLTALVDTLLSASRLEAGRTPVHLEPLSVGDITLAAIDAATSEAPHLQVTISIADDLPFISADAALATRALANVLSNAAKYAEGSPVSVSARCADHRVILEVADRGPGLGANPDRLLEKFVRGVENDGRAPGLGLGLALARSFMDSQGGSLSAANRDDGGALFTLSFACWTKAARDGH